jgi:UDP:flavonoid glycosyltransferase YjiC (YdhE family)
MNVMFTVQGEGRGHMTQAIAMSQMLKRRGHRVVAVLAGQNQSRQLPDFFAQAFDVPVTPMASPGFVMK